VLIERQRIEQVLVNLLDNAADHSPADSPIEIELDAAPAGLARVRAIDRGAGRRRAAVHRMFEPFFTTRAAATGLGLCIAKGIVEDHGGASAPAQRSAPGLTVEFTLPLAPRASRDEAAHPDPRRRGRGPHQLLLLPARKGFAVAEAGDAGRGATGHDVAVRGRPAAAT
jgi:K+-sensing histidine kinase KdpD